MRESRPTSLGFACALMLVAALVAAQARDLRIIAVGDVHGALAEFQAILQQTGLTNSDNQWVAGRTVFVQTGDVVDRGPQSRESIDFLMELEVQARRQFGRVITLLGNHEVMAMTGDFRYVSPEDYNGFATSRSERVRQDAYRDYLDFVSSRSGQVGDSARTEREPESREQWMLDHPLGFFERRDAFGPQGVYGGWLRRQDVVVRVGDGVFVHGGLNPALSLPTISELNQQMRLALANFDALWESLSRRKIFWNYATLEEALLNAQSEWEIVRTSRQTNSELSEELQQFLVLCAWLTASDNPVWFRGLAQGREDELTADLDAMLASMNVRYIVAGHTVVPQHEITARFDDRVFLIDTGMLGSFYGGRASALEIQDGEFTAHYPGARPLRLLASPNQAALSRR